ncbi:TetR/AcrR family transcriptional regulator [Sphaerisporangium fuscum]|uniref:TetR/AcrR family transcriptional regulator n=1 Tax=Sphaerisporangium fuscum TaxID=2835868 RepID=UPI001BDD1181|nr:TetR/AcrR family transcriptional regulator [Sphaerisporangium fuscum]
MNDELGLRERKKRQTRQMISDVASGLFMHRGFDKVTVAEIAEAANVSTKTVFNYFPRKEDLFFDRFPEAEELVTDAIHGRAQGVTPLTALRHLFHDLLRRGHPLAGIGEGYQYFWQVVLDSPALQARLREWAEEMEGLLAALLAEADGADPDDPLYRMTAAFTVAAFRTSYAINVRKVSAGERLDQVAADHAALFDRALDAVERAATTLSP